jgi:hypothetical protein
MGNKHNKGNKAKKKLLLGRETMRRLTPDQLKYAAGGNYPDDGGTSMFPSNACSNWNCC